MEDYSKYTKEELQEMFEDIDTPIYQPNQVAIKLCEIWSCENCPVTIFNCDTRTEFDRKIGYSSCQNELWKWIKGE